MTTAVHPKPAALELPSPADFPAADVVIYDGHCKFCRAGVSRLHRLDGKNRLAFLSLHDPEVTRRWPDLTHEMLMAEMYVIDQQGHRYPGARAVRYLSRRLPVLWIAAPVLHIPCSLPLWQAGYRWVANMRYRWGKIDDCEDGACKVHFGKK
jgi:predicted DCC family thiol-disulfide oxidoreductase YuxK